MHEESISITVPDLKLTNVQGVAPINLHLCFIEATMQNMPRAEIKDEDHIALPFLTPHRSNYPASTSWQALCVKFTSQGLERVQFGHIISVLVHFLQAHGMKTR